ATESLAKQTEELRELVAAEYDANKAQAEFLQRQEYAAAIFESTRTPMEQARLEVEKLADAFQRGDIDAETFQRRIAQMAEELADAGKRVRNAWTGLGDDISQVLGSIAIDGRSPLKG